MLRILSILLCAIAIQAQTNQKPYRLLVADGKLVVSGGKILNHQTYVASRVSNNWEHGWSLQVSQTNSSAVSAPEDFATIHSVLAVDGNLFHPESAYTNFPPLEVSYGWTASWPTDPKSRTFSYVLFDDFVNPPNVTYELFGGIAAPMFRYDRPTAPLSELVRIDVAATAAKLATFTGSVASLPATAGNLTPLSGSGLLTNGTDAVQGVLVIPSAWATIPSYTVVPPPEDNDYSYDYLDGSGFRHAARVLNQSIDRLDFTNPATNVIWRFHAIKEYY